MRNAFASVMTEMAQADESLVLLYGDSGNRLFNELKDSCPGRAINAGIAEANMTSVAAGFALNGHRPVTYAITPFNSSRCFEQIKVDIAYQNLPVIIVGTGSGLAYASLGPTHHSFEDIAIVRSLPNMQIIQPADSASLKSLFKQIVVSAKPTYFRIGKKKEPILYADPDFLEIGKVHIVSPGKKVGVLVSGPILGEVLKAKESLGDMTDEVEIVDCHTLKPFDSEYLVSAAKRFTSLITVEEHSVAGGLGSIVLEHVSDLGLQIKVTRMGIPDRFLDKLSSQAVGRTAAGVDAGSIASAMREQILQ